MRRLVLPFAALAAYLPASSLAVLSDDLGADPSLLVVPFCAGFAVAFPAWGRLADRAEHRLVMVWALVALAATGGLLAAAGGDAWVAAARALQGVAAAGVPPAAQAALTRASGDARAGRAIGAMMVAVAVATLAGPGLAAAVATAAGWRGSVLALTVAVPLLAAAVTALGGPRTAGRAPGAAGRARLGRPGAGLSAGWLVSALVLGGYWTTLTRLGEILSDDGLAAGGALTAAAPLTGALGIPLVLLAGRAADARGPRGPMLVTLAAGAAGLTGAAAAGSAGAFVAFAAIAFAAYWAYLPVVSVQVQRSVAPAVRGQAVGGLYASMWLGAAVAGGLAPLLGDWRPAVAAAAGLWALAAVVAARGFLGEAPSSSPWPILPRQPVPRSTP